MTREEKIKHLSEAMAQEMMTWDKSEIEDRLGAISGSSDIVVLEYAKLYWKGEFEKYTDKELDTSWWWQADYKGEINGVKP